MKGSRSTIVIVSGLPRSGTSLMMQMLEAGGVPPLTDELRRPDGDNPRGYYELERVKALRHGDTGWLRRAGGHAVKVISELLSWLPRDYRYDVIFMRRSLAEVLRSQRLMLARRGADGPGASDERLKELYEKHLREVEDWLGTRPEIRAIHVEYAELVESPGPQVERIDAFLGVGLDTAAMAAVVDPALYRQRTGNAGSTA